MQLSILPDLFAPEDLLPEERRVWDLLQHRRGEANAITKDRLSGVLGMHERVVRDAIKSLVEVRRKRIGSTPGQPAGYFVIESDAEALRVCDRYHGQALSILRRERVLRQITVAELVGQLSLELREETG